jgi:hypothetical protein
MSKELQAAATRTTRAERDARLMIKEEEAFAAPSYYCDLEHRARAMCTRCMRRRPRASCAFDAVYTA